jgi:hypothetical protein
MRPGRVFTKGRLPDLPSLPVTPTQRGGHLLLHSAQHTLKGGAHPEFPVPGHPPLRDVSRVRLDVQGAMLYRRSYDHTVGGGPRGHSVAAYRTPMRAFLVFGQLGTVSVGRQGPV